MKKNKRWLKIIVSLIFILVSLQYIINPKYTFSEPQIFKGEKWHNPYTNIDSTEWIRANFHLHTKQYMGITNGHLNTNESVDSFYRYFDYDIFCISDYMNINNHLDDSDIHISVYEHGYHFFKTHQLVINTTNVRWLDYPFYQSRNNKQFIIDWLKQDSSAFVTIVHPAYRKAFKPSDFKYLGNFDCLEIVNNRNNFVEYFDSLLSGGNAKFLMANDDAHNLSIFGDGAHSFNVANSCYNKDSILGSIKDGKSYGVFFNHQKYNNNKEKRNGLKNLPSLKQLSISEDTLYVSIDQEVDSIKFIGQHGILKHYITDSKEGKYPLAIKDTYIRTEVITKDSSVLYFNPVFRYNGSIVPVSQPIINKTKTRNYRIIFGLFIVLIIWFQRRIK